MKNKKLQSGMTLIVSLIMLIALTLLVVSAIRTGNTNLRVVGNMQVQHEASSAAQQAIEEVLDTDFTGAPTAQDIPVTMGAVTYTVNVNEPLCTDTVPISKDQLNASDPNDQLCFGEQDAHPVIDDDGNQLFTSAKCNIQAWEIQADVDDAASGASTSVVQGISRRTYLPTAC